MNSSILRSTVLLGCTGLFAPPAFAYTELQIADNAVNLTPDRPSHADKARIFDMPAGTSFVAATSVPGACVESASEIVCTIGELAVAGTAAVQIQLSADAAGPHTFTAFAGADQTDPDDTNNTVVLTTTVRANADLAISPTATGGVQTGGQITVTLGVVNNGPQAATNVVVPANLPTTIVNLVSSTGCTASGAVVTCTSASLAAGGTVNYTVVLSATLVGTGAVSASVTADENDPNTANNSATVNVTVLAPARSGGGGGGGCVYDPAGSFDPTLLVLLAGSLLALGRRRRVSA